MTGGKQTKTTVTEKGRQMSILSFQKNNQSLNKKFKNLLIFKTIIKLKEVFRAYGHNIFNLVMTIIHNMTNNKKNEIKC